MGTITISQPSSNTLVALADTLIATLADNDILQYNSGNSLWENTTLANAGISPVVHTHTEADITDLQAYLLNINNEPLSDLADVTISAIAANELIQWDGAAWINRTLAEAGISPTVHTHTESDITDLQSYLLDITGEPLSDLSDVLITAIGAGELIKWDGAQWVNNTLSEAGISPAVHTHTESDITDLQSYLLDTTDTFTGVLSLVGSQTITGDFTVDTNTFYVDSTNDRVGVGTNAPGAIFEIAGVGSSTEDFRLSRATSSAAYVSISAPGNTPNRSTFGVNGINVMALDVNARVVIGSITAPDGTLHVHSGSAGAVTAHVNADELIVEHSTSGGINILTPDLSFGALLFGSPSNNAGGQLRWNYSSNLLGLGTSNASAELVLSSGNDVEAMRIDSNQNVGIGAIPETWLSIFTAVQVGGNGALFADTVAGAGKTINLSQNIYHDGAWRYISTDEASRYEQDSGIHRFLVTPSGAADAPITWTTAMVIDNGGNVGIGTPTPSALLDLEHPTAAYLEMRQTAAANDGPQINLIDSSNRQMMIRGPGALTNAFLGTVTNHDLMIGTGGLTAITVASNQRVGIGTDNPLTNLQIGDTSANLNLGGTPTVNGTGRISYITTNTTTNWRLSSNDNASGRFEITPSTVEGGSVFSTPSIIFDSEGRVIIGANTSGSDNSMYIDAFGIVYIFRGSGPANGMMFFYNGGVEVGSIRTSTTMTTYSTTSDYRVKNNVTPINNATKIVMSLKPCEYTFSATPDIKNTGFLAHELQQHIPQAVTGEKDAKEMQSADYSKIVAVLTASLQDAHREIEKLRIAA